jgi:hypothetical protein
MRVIASIWQRLLPADRPLRRAGTNTPIRATPLRSLFPPTPRSKSRLIKPPTTVWSKPVFIPSRRMMQFLK